MIDFLIIGGTKCGSTSLADYVASSRKVNFCQQKEPAILNRKNLTTEDITFYQSLYLDKPGIKGEATPAYSDCNQVDTVIKNIRRLGANPKIVLSVRNPVKRIQSSYIEKIKAGKIKHGQFSQIPLTINPGTINRGMFGHVINKYIDAFSKEAVLVLNFDELIEPDSQELIKLKDFLGLESDLPNILPRSNSSIGGLKKHWIAIFYKKYIHHFWKKNRLPSLRFFAPILRKFSGKVKPAEALSLTEKQITFLREQSREDEALFREIIGWSYWDLVK